MTVEFRLDALLELMSQEEKTDFLLEAYTRCGDSARHALFAESIHDIPTAFLENELLDRECRFRKTK